VSLEEGVAVPDVGAGGWVDRDVSGVIWKFSWIGTERTRRWGRGVGDVDIWGVQTENKMQGIQG
jgi:hypothetical protein